MSGAPDRQGGVETIELTEDQTRALARPNFPREFAIPLTTDTIAVSELRLELRFAFGVDITTACRAAVFVAECAQAVVGFEFNGFQSIAAPGLTPDDVEAIYWDRLGYAMSAQP